MKSNAVSPWIAAPVLLIAIVGSAIMKRSVGALVGAVAMYVVGVFFAAILMAMNHAQPVVTGHAWSVMCSATLIGGAVLGAIFVNKLPKW